eukprot:4104573-Pleurochrysis_carterae.AAC.1
MENMKSNSETLNNTNCIGVQESSPSDAVRCSHTAELAGKGRLSEAAAPLFSINDWLTNHH